MACRKRTVSTLAQKHARMTFKVDLNRFAYRRRLANLPKYRNLPQCMQLVKEVADELKIESPLHSD